RLERTVKRIAPDPETHRDAIGIQCVLEIFCVAAARAFVEKRRQQIADTLLAFGIELRAALDRELQRDDRHGRILYRPDRQARRRFNFLYIQIRLCLHGKRHKQRKCKEKLFHLTFSGVRTAIRTFLYFTATSSAAALTASPVTARLRSGQASTVGTSRPLHNASPRMRADPITESRA